MAKKQKKTYIKKEIEVEVLEYDGTNGVDCMVFIDHEYSGVDEAKAIADLTQAFPISKGEFLAKAAPWDCVVLGSADLGSKYTKK